MLSSVQQLYLMHLASLVGVAALAFRNQLHLRTVLLASIALNIADHLFIKGGPNTNSLVWDVVALGINTTLIVNLLLDRTHIGLTAEEQRLFQAWGSLSPGEFRKLLRVGVWRTATVDETLTHEGAVPDRLFYVLEGDLHLIKGGRGIVLAAPTFIGEVAFVKERPASATVQVVEGGRYVEWPADTLRGCFSKNQSLRVAAMRLISADMAMKVARA